MTGGILRRSSRAVSVACLSVFVAVALMVPRPAFAEPMREFVLSCSYGVLAGTLVGAATLAFVDKPGDNLNRVARGASIGLYGGILLGLYVVYGVPSEEDEDMPVALLNAGDELNAGPARLSSRLLLAGGESAKVRFIEPPRFQIMPVVSDRGLEGASARLSLLNF